MFLLYPGLFHFLHHFTSLFIIVWNCVQAPTLMGYQYLVSSGFSYHALLYPAVIHNVAELTGSFES